MKPKKSFDRMFRSALLAHGFVKFYDGAFVIRINPETRGYVGMASSGDYSSRPRLRPFVGVINEQVVEVKQRATETTQHPFSRERATPVISIALAKLLTAEELKRAFIEQCGPLTEWVLEAANESEVAGHIVDGILKHGLPLMQRLDSVEQIYQTISGCLKGNKSGYAFNLLSSMAILLFLTGRGSEAEAYAESDLATINKRECGDDYKSYWSAVQENLVKLFRTKDA